MGLLDLYAQFFEAKIFNIADNTNGKNRPVEFLVFLLAGLVCNFCCNGGLARFQIFDFRACNNVQALLLEVLFREFRNFSL